MKKSILLYLFICMVGINFLPLHVQAAETSSVTINCLPDTENGEDALTFFYALKCADTGSQLATIYSDGENNCIFYFPKNSSIQITVEATKEESSKYITDIYINNTNLNFGNGLTGKILSPNKMQITGTITGDTSITIRAVSSAFKNVFNYDETVEENTSNVIEEESRQVTPGSRYEGLKRVISLVPSEDKSDVWKAVKAKLAEFTDLINIITNAFVAFGILTGILVLIIHFVKIQMMPAHPTQRHKSLVELMSAVVCIALLGSIKLLTVLILSIAAS